MGRMARPCGAPACIGGLCLLCLGRTSSNSRPPWAEAMVAVTVISNLGMLPGMSPKLYTSLRTAEPK
jgi:hypothetical protein